MSQGIPLLAILLLGAVGCASGNPPNGDATSAGSTGSGGGGPGTTTTGPTGTGGGGGEAGQGGSGQGGAGQGGSGQGGSGQGGSGGTATGESCADAIDITAQIAQSGVYTGSPSALPAYEASPTCATYFGAHSVLLWDVPAAGSYMLSFSAPNGDPALESQSSVLVRLTCDDPGSELGCWGGWGTASIPLGVLQPVTVAIHLQGDWFANGYTVSVTEEPPCSADGDCTSSGFNAQVCTAGGICAECDDTGDCDNRVCDTALGQCFQCTSNADCAGHPLGSYCNNGSCYGCVADSECAGHPHGQVCLPSSHSCGCVTASDCAGSGDACVQGHCVACAPGMIDCDGLASNGCEVDPMVNPAHCGGCTGCMYGVCTAGVCTAPPEQLYAGMVEDFAVDDQAVFFAEGGSIHRIPKAGGAPMPVVMNQGNIDRIAVDATHVYWTGGAGVQGGTNYVRRALKSGGVAEDLFTTTSVSFGDLELDATDVYVVVDSTQSNYVTRIPKSGGGSTTLAQDVWIQPYLALAGDHVYFNDLFTVHRVPKAGGAEVSLGFDAWIKTDGLGLFYGADAFVTRRELDGTSPQQLGGLPPGWGESSVLAVSATHVYFHTETAPAGALPNAGSIWHNGFLFAAPKAGGPAVMIGSGEANFRLVRTDATHVYWLAAGKILRLAH